MKELYSALKDFVQDDFDWLVYGLTILVLGVCMYINYSPTVDVSPFNLGEGFWPRLQYYTILYGGSYFLTAFLCVKGAKVEFLKDWKFWVLGACFVFIAMIPKLHIFRLIDVRAYGWNLAEMVFVSKCHFFIHQMVMALGGLAIVKLLFHKWADLDFGFRGDWKTLKPYFLVLAIVAPLIIGASFFPDFQRAYPQYKPWNFVNVFDLSVSQRAAIFEPSYAMGFVAVESLFRGALAITMVKIMGPRAVIAMASFYCVFHFGKPAGEAVGAFFGGYALGVLAIHSKSIYGGLIVHLGVAMLMESMGYLHHYL